MKPITPYPECLTRLEGRGLHPPTKEYIAALTRFAEETGVQAFWHSAVDPKGRPLFPSKVIPNAHPQANYESFHDLLKRMHALGRPVVCWYPFFFNRAVLEAHPDWAIQFYTADGSHVPMGDGVCPNSPYGEMLPAFCAEVIRDLQFDGFWFDGFRWDQFDEKEMKGRPGCHCSHCQARFLRDTGHELPARLAPSDRVVRLWIKWRYAVVLGISQRVVAAIHAARSDATVAFNNYRRRPCSFYNARQWITGITLNPWGLDCLMSGEVGYSWAETPFQIKMHLAYDCRQGAETWLPLANYAHCWVPDLDMLGPLQAAYGAASAGGVMSCGTGTAHQHIVGYLRELSGAINPLAPYLRGEPIPYAARLMSESTMDFYGEGHERDLWNDAHGTIEILKHAHLPSAILFEKHLEQETLSRYPAVILGNCACLSQRHAQLLENYAREGGVLFGCKETGVFDELGYRHDHPVLDDLFGIVSRRESAHPHLPTLEILDQDLQAVCGDYQSFTGIINLHMESYMCVEAAKGVEVLANVVCRDYERGDMWDEEGINGGKRFPRYPGLLRKKVGRGWAIYACVNFFFSYMMTPRATVARMFKRLVGGLHPPTITLEGPMCVSMNARRLGKDRIVVHLHNTPGTIYNFPTPQENNSLCAIGELNPVFDLEIRTHGLPVCAAERPLRRRRLEVIGDHAVKLDRLDQHEVVLLTVRRS